MEALAEFPSPPRGWKTGTAALRGAASSCRKVPMSPVRDWIRQSRSCTCGGLVIDPSCTRRIPAPVTCMDHQAAKSAWATASEVPGRLAQIRREESGTFHLQRPRYRPALDRGAGKGHLVVDREPPATGPMCPQIKSQLFCSFYSPGLLLNCTGECRNLPFCTNARPRGALRMPPGAGAYRAIRANMERTCRRKGLDHDD
jgi:hypothetical protein